MPIHAPAYAPRGDDVASRAAASLAPARGQSKTRRTFDLLWLIFSRQLRLTWLLFIKE